MVVHVWNALASHINSIYTVNTFMWLIVFPMKLIYCNNTAICSATWMAECFKWVFSCFIRHSYRLWNVPFSVCCDGKGQMSLCINCSLAFYKFHCQPLRDFFFFPQHSFFLSRNAASHTMLSGLFIWVTEKSSIAAAASQVYILFCFFFFV